MHRCVLLSLCGLLISQPLFAKDDTFHFPTEELQNLYGSAQAALESKEYGKARQYYRSLVRQGACQALESAHAVDLLLSLAHIEEEVACYEEAISILTNILQYELPQGQLHRAMMALARCYQKSGAIDSAQAVLNKLEEWEPSSAWSREERTFALSVKMSLHHFYSEIAAQAERYLEGGLYAEATPLYREILTAIEEGCYTLGDEHGEIQERARLRLAECLFQRGLESEVIALLRPVAEGEAPKSDAGRRALYLLGLAEMREEQYATAVHRFTSYIALAPRESGYWEDAEWERALCFYHLGHLPAAESCLQTLVREGKRPKLVQLAQVYRARIQLETGQFAALDSTLELLSASTPADDLLVYEIAYLKGESAFRRGDYLVAAHRFEEALPKRNQEKANWYAGALYNLGWSYLKLGDDPKRETPSQAALLYKAEQAFKRLISLNRDERAYLGLARVYLAQVHRLRDRDARKRIEALLSKPELFSTLDGRAEALLVRTEALRDFSVREALYQELTDPIYQETPSYPEGWYARGLNHFEQGEQLRRHGESVAAVVHYQSAAQELLRAFELLRSKEASKAGAALKFAAQAYYNQNTPEGHRLAFGVLETLLTDYRNLFERMEGRDEILYLRGLMASVLLSETGEEHYIEAAEWSLSQVVAEYPSSRFAPSALHVLGTMHFHQGHHAVAEQIFVQLGRDYPDSRYAGDAWFWAAESADWQQKEGEVVRDYRRRVYEQYGESYFAAEAYFNSYSFSEYLQGDREAIDHLRQMADKYPRSPYLIVAHYLTGLEMKQDRRSPQETWVHAKDLSAAADLFARAEEMFTECYANGRITTANLEYFTTIYYRARLEGAMTTLTLASDLPSPERDELFKEAEVRLKGVVAEFSDPNHPLASLLSRGQAYPRVLEEAHFGLARLNLAVKDDVAAEATLHRMVDRYREGQVGRGYYLSRVWYELGRIAMRRGEYPNALNCLNRAEDSAKQGVLSREQQLDLWVQMSLCYRAQGMLDEAMLTLSRVINDDSTSGLRIQAMYLRAEIYELQGRHELAVKQLEATSRKGGAWAAKATEKMRRDYGFN